MSEYIKEKVTHALKADNVHVLHNGIDIRQFHILNDEYKKQSIRDKYHIPQDKFVLCFSGRICKEKGVLELIKAYSMLNDYPDFALVIIGSAWFGKNASDPYLELLKQESKKCCNDIIFTGYVDNKDVAEIESVSNAAVLPSLWEEPLSLSVMEAMACGLPVITTNAGGIPEVCNDNTGFVLERTPHLSEEMCKKILELSVDSNLCKRLGTEGRKVVEQHFSDRQYYDEFMRIICEE